MNPELTVAVGRDLEPLDGETLDAGLVGSDENRVGAGRDPQHLETQRRHGRTLRLHHHRHAPDDAVALGPDREQAAPGSRLFQDVHVAQQTREIEQERLRLLAEHRQPRQRKRLVEFRNNVRQPGFAHHHARAPNRVREKLIVARQRSQFGPGLLIEIANGVGRDVGIEPVGLGEHDIEGDHDGAEPGQVGDEIRDPRPRPRPLAEFR